MTTWTQNSKNNTSWTNTDKTTTNLFFLIDDTFFFLIDATHKLIIDSGVNIDWNYQTKN